jgi:hypothetical protein
MQEFIPGASPPEVNTPILFSSAMMTFRLTEAKMIRPTVQFHYKTTQTPHNGGARILSNFLVVKSG